MLTYCLGQYKLCGQFQPKPSLQVTLQALASLLGKLGCLAHSLRCGDQEKSCAGVTSQLSRALPSNLPSRQLPEVIKVTETRGQGLGAHK